MTGQPPPRTVWMAVRLTVMGVAVTCWAAAVAATAGPAAAARAPTATTAVRVVEGRMGRSSHARLWAGRFMYRRGYISRPTRARGGLAADFEAVLRAGRRGLPARGELRVAERA